MERITQDDVETTEAIEGAHLAQMAAGERISIQHFFIEPSEEVPEHSHEHEQAGYLTDGALTFLVSGEEVLVEAGDSYVIPGDEPHAVENRGDVPAKGIDIFSPPRTNPPWEDETGR